MKFRSLIALALVLASHTALAQVTPGTSPLSIAKGGTAAATAAAARTSLGLAIGTNVEAWNPNLDSLAALAASADTCFYFSSSGTFTMSTYSCSSFSRAVLANASAPGWRTALGVAIGTNVEAWDTDLDCLAAISTTGVIRRTGSGTCSAGTVALSDLATGTQDTVIGYFGSTAASALAIGNCSNALTYSTSTHTFGCNATAGTGTVTSSGPPAPGQVAQFTSATNVQGVPMASFLTQGAGITITNTAPTATISQSLTNATLPITSAGSPAGTVSGSSVMMGLGSTCKLTPVYSTRIQVSFFGDISNTAVAITNIKLQFGTGAAPANGAGSTGTTLGAQQNANAGAANQVMPFANGGIVTGLTPGTAYWFDEAVAVAAGTGTITHVSCSAIEL